MIGFKSWGTKIKLGEVRPKYKERGREYLLQIRRMFSSRTQTEQVGDSFSFIRYREGTVDHAKTAQYCTTFRCCNFAYDEAQSLIKCWRGGSDVVVAGSEPLPMQLRTYVILNMNYIISVMYRAQRDIR